jgi:hypothetical protein
MGEVDERLCHIRHREKAAMNIQTMFNEAEGIAPCHQPLITKPAAPTRFIHWNKGERPVSRSVEISR